MDEIAPDAREQVERIAGRFEPDGVPLIRFVIAFFSAQQREWNDFTKREEVLTKAAEDFIKEQHERRNLAGSDPEARRLQELAEREFRLGNDKAAHNIMQQSIAIDDRVAEWQLSNLKQWVLSAAEKLATQASWYSNSLAYREAANLFLQAANKVAGYDGVAAWKYLQGAGGEYENVGYFSGDNQALVEAIDTYQKSLVYVPRGADPANWSATQNNLGNALRALASVRAGRRGSMRPSRPTARP
jgi:tetratricopeptide (TPR) repeat protein